MIQLNPQIPLDTKKGPGYAIGVMDYSQDHSLLWVVAITETREIWICPNEEVLIDTNWTLGRHRKPKNGN